MNQDENVDITQLIVPFEDSTKDFFSGLFETIKLVLFKPANFFRNYKLDGSIGRPLLFAVIIGWAASAVGIIWGTLLRESIFSILHQYFPDVEGVDWDQIGSEWAMQGLGSTFAIVLAPIGIVIALFIIAGIYHLFLLIVKGANKNFETTFNVVAYGTVSRIAEIIPFCGSLVSFLYGIILAIIGLTEAHRTDSWKVVFAVFGPLILCCTCCILMILVLGGTGFLTFLSRSTT